MLINIWRFIVVVLKRFVVDDCPIQAAGLSYVTLLSLVPLMTLCLSVLSAFPVFSGIGANLQHLIISNFVGSSAHTIQHHLQNFLLQTRKLSSLGLVFFLLTAVLMIFSMEQAFSRIWRLQNRRGIVQSFLIYWAVLTLGPVLLGVGMTSGSNLLALHFSENVMLLATVKKALIFISPYFFVFMFFTMLYVTLPNCKVKIRHAAIGAFIAMLLFNFAKAGFAFYIKHFPTYVLIYGALAAIPLFLIWLYVSWLIILFGAVITHEIA
ncbi:MAG: YihY family inner membrane protein [Gammaproteobacteria bacterium]|nr:YihY family inner membrane protein [Gammaproteobacteria bacterium]